MASSSHKKGPEIETFDYYCRIPKQDDGIIRYIIGKKGAFIKQFQVKNGCWIASWKDESSGDFVFKITTRDEVSYWRTACMFEQLVRKTLSRSIAHSSKDDAAVVEDSGNGGK